MIKQVLAATACMSIAGAVTALTAPANQMGFVPQGTFTVGHCVMVAGAINNNTFVLADAGVACGGQSISIGQKVNGAVANSALSVDANGNLAQISALTAN